MLPKKWWFLCSLLLLSLPDASNIVLSAENAVPVCVQANNDQIEFLMSSVRKQFGLLKYTLESFIDDITSGTITLKNGKKVIEEVQKLRELVETVLNDNYLTPDLTTIATLEQTLRLIIDNLSAGISNGFVDWQAHIPQTRSAPNAIPGEIIQTFVANEQQLNVTGTQLQTLGLGKMRRAYRAFNHFIERHPATKTITKYSAVAAGLALIFLWYIKSPHLNEQGYAVDPKGSFLEKKDLAWYTYVAQFINSMPMNKLGVIPWLVFGEQIRQTITTGIEKTGTALHAIHCRMLGVKVPSDVHMEYPTRGFEDIRGNMNNKREAMKIIEYVANYERFAQKNIAFQRGVLLLGKTRSGKTFFAEKVCGEINKRRKGLGLPPCPFIQVDAGNMRALRNNIGLSAYLYLAREKAPCVLFIDEIHNLLQNDKNVLNELLTGMSGAFNDAEKPVIIIAATNQPEKLDNALRQKGRFGIELTFDYPHFQDRKEHLKAVLQSALLKIDDQYLTALAHETDSYSFEDLNEMIAHIKQEANIDKKPVTIQLLEEALDKVIRKIQEPDAPLNAQVKKIAAVHIASQLVATARLSDKIITKATLLPVQIRTNNEIATQQGSVFSYTIHDNGHWFDPEMLVVHCKELLAGHAGEQMIYGASAYSYKAEAEEALTICKQLSFQGLGKNQLSNKLHDKLLSRALDLKMQYEVAVKELLTREKEAVLAIAGVLEEKITLSQSEITALLKKYLDRSPKAALGNGQPETSPKAIAA